MYTGLDYFAVMQSVIADMMLSFGPLFEDYSLSVFWAVATINVAFLAFHFLTNRGGTSDWGFTIAWTFLKLAIARFFVVYYSRPDPLFGVSFSHLIVDQMHAFTALLDASGVKTVVTTIDAIGAKFIPPGWGEWYTTIVYFVFFMVMSAAKLYALAVMALGLFGQAILILVGPIFVCLFLVPRLDEFFWNWFRALVQYSFLPVTAFAYLFIGAHLFTAVLTRTPDGITSQLLVTYAGQIGLIMAVWIYGFTHIPAINAAIFHGGGSHSLFSNRQL